MTQLSNTLILIPARMGSTRLPNKPLADINGKTMIVRVWEAAIAANCGDVVVACDAQEIADVIIAAGGKAILTRADHPSGSDRIWEAYTHLDPQGRYEIIVNVQGDLPALDPDLIHTVIKPLKNTSVDISTLACIIKDEEEKQDPAVVKPVISFAQNTGQCGKALYFTRCPAPYGEGELYHHIGIYAYRRDSLRRFVSLPPSPLELREKLEQLRALENGMRIDVMLVETVPLGVDTPQHLEKARTLCK